MFNSYSDEVAHNASQLIEKIGENTYKSEVARIP